MTLTRRRPHGFAIALLVIALTGCGNNTEQETLSSAPPTPPGTDDPATAPGTDDPTTPPGTDDPATPPGTDDLTTPPGTNDPTTPPGTNDPTTPPGTHDPATPPGTDDPTTPPGANDPTTPPGTNDPTTPPGTDDPTTPPGTNDPALSAQAIVQLRAYLAIPVAVRPKLGSQPFVSTSLTQSDAQTARDLLWQDFADVVRSTRSNEVSADENTTKSLVLNGYELKYYQGARGGIPPDGRSLFIGMHGGGTAPNTVNNRSWEGYKTWFQGKAGYQIQDAIWLVPRSPTNTWNMWFQDHMDGLLDRLITNMIVFEEVNPNKIYLMGYSAGGDGVYRLATRMPDRWAGASMGGGHPGNVDPQNLRNLAFTIDVGALDTPYHRNGEAQRWGKALDQLAASDPGAYPHRWTVHPGKGHTDLFPQDMVAVVPFLQSYTRNPAPQKVVWQQTEVTQSRFYWLAVDNANRRRGTEVTARYAGNTIDLTGIHGLTSLTIRLSDAMMNLDSPVQIKLDGKELFFGVVPRTIDTIERTLNERGDPAMSFSGQVHLNFP